MEHIEVEDILSLPEDFRAIIFVTDMSELQRMCDEWMGAIRDGKGVTEVIILEMDDNKDSLLDSKLIIQARIIASCFRKRGFMVKIITEQVVNGVDFNICNRITKAIIGPNYNYCKNDAIVDNDSTIKYKVNEENLFMPTDFQAINFVNNMEELQILRNQWMQVVKIGNGTGESVILKTKDDKDTLLDMKLIIQSKKIATYFRKRGFAVIIKTENILFENSHDKWYRVIKAILPRVINVGRVMILILTTLYSTMKT